MAGILVGSQETGETGGTGLFFLGVLSESLGQHLGIDQTVDAVYQPFDVEVDEESNGMARQLQISDDLCLRRFPL
jgi:hypothetical protein